MKKCELCNRKARLFCESDEASLCWECDANVHSANFIVTKHFRFLLCHSCHSLTPWHASGPHVLPIISFCNLCIPIPNPAAHIHRTHTTQDQHMDAGEEEDHAEDEENQVVPPWTSTPPPSVASSSSSISECSSDVQSEEGLSD